MILVRIRASFPAFNIPCSLPYARQDFTDAPIVTPHLESIQDAGA